ncbi:protein translocase subunit [Coemansia erecta]|nr:protein translocase subunit [Coemansia erecta]
MSSFGNFSIGSSGSGAQPTKEQIMDEVRNEVAVANAQELIKNINTHCFKLCVPSPGSSLSRSEEASMGRCIDKYLASWDAVSRAYVAKVHNK